jgi:hypothetical protein
MGLGDGRHELHGNRQERRPDHLQDLPPEAHE